MGHTRTQRSHEPVHTNHEHTHLIHEHAHYRRKYQRFKIYLISGIILVLVLSCIIIKLHHSLVSQQQEISSLSKSNYELAVSYPFSSTAMHISDLDISFRITEEDVIVLSKMVYGEARGVKPRTVGNKYVTNTEQMAACVWSVLNRIDSGYAATITEVVTAPNQYTGYSPTNPVKEEYATLVRDVLLRWQFEKVLNELGVSSEVGRTLPAPDGNNLWCWFLAAKDGTGNVFRSRYENGAQYTWYLPSPYKNNI